MINIIVAYAQNFAIGKDGKIPWHLPEDMQHFKEVTAHYPVVMGRKTWDSIPDKFRPLPGRMNIVITREPRQALFFDPKQPHWANSLKAALKLADFESREIFIIGGAEIYKQALDSNVVQRVIASEIKEPYEGDVFFPDLKQMGWGGTVTKEFEKFNVVEYVKDGV